MYIQALSKAPKAQTVLQYWKRLWRAKPTQIAYNHLIKALFVELPAFARHRSDYLDDEGFRGLQNALLDNPEAGDVIEGTGGLRVIYFWWSMGDQFWLYTVYDKDTIDDLSAKERAALKDMLKRELSARRK